MSNLRNRHQRESSAKHDSATRFSSVAPRESEDDGDLSRPLVDHDDDTGATPLHGRNRSTATEASPGIGSSLFEVADVASTWILDKLPNAWSTVFVPSVAPALRGRIANLESARLRPYDKENPAHRSALVALWEACHRLAPAHMRLASTAADLDPTGTLVSAHWKQFGFQGTDPATDFRGAGLFGLDNIVFLAEQRPVAFGHWLCCTIPFAIASINVTMSLLNLLGLTLGRTTCLATAQPNRSYTAQPNRSYTAQPNRSYTAQLSKYHFTMWVAETGRNRGGDDDGVPAMERVFCDVHYACCLLLYDEWARIPAMKRNIMLFNQHLKAAVLKLEEFIRKSGSQGAERLLSLVETAVLPPEDQGHQPIGW